jgi:8-hydroxy-5-deazaflavin:NADPH oxidoreductase
MKIAIIGSGLMGSALGKAWAQSEHQIFFTYSRDNAKLETLARQAGHGALAASPADAAAQADVILLSVPWHRLDDVLAQTGSLADKIVLSCMLPMTNDDSGLALGFTTSGAETLAEKTGARVISTFNTVWSNVINIRPSDKPRSLFYVGNDAEAKQVAEQLIRDAGFEPVDAGSLRDARLLEPFGLLMGQLGFAYDPLVAYHFLKP